MQKIIDQILEGNFDYGNGSLDFSCSKIEITLHSGEIYEGSFRIFSSQGIYANGSVISSDLRMECLTEEFAGDEEIIYRFHGENLEAGDVVRGYFYIISNQGEYYLPFSTTALEKTLDSSVGVIKNMFHFANLARSSWNEAVKLFYSQEFPKILTGRDAQYADAYRALSAVAGVEQNMEEFLILVNKKQKVEYMVEEGELLLEPDTELSSGSVLERELTIYKNGWGYTRLFVECSGSFFFTEKEVLTDDDFLGNYCRLPVFIDGNLCGRGNNYGEIYLYNSYASLTIPVTVKLGNVSQTGKLSLDRRRLTAQLTKTYLAFRMKKISTAVWLKESGVLVDKLVMWNENDIEARLFQAQTLITEERFNEAGWILDHVSDLLGKNRADAVHHAYYLYLTSLIHREESYVNRVAEEVEQIYRRNDADWRVAWLLLYLSEDFHKSGQAKWQFVERQFEMGARSPILYIEAVTMLNNNPALLRKLENFEMQTVWYGAKQDLLSPETTEQLLYLTGRAREYQPVLYRILVKLYDQKHDVRFLQEICTLLIKGGKVGQRYFEWFEAGVNAKLRITNLFEYYMMSLDLNIQQDLPRTVLMYFSYQNNLDFEHSAYLYDYVLSNAGNLGDLMDVYRPKMESFVLDQIRKEHVNRHLANLYNKLLQPGMIDEDTCGPLSRLLFAHLIQVEDDRLRKVYVYQPGNLFPAEYVLSDGQTWAALYGADYTIVFEDGWNNRFIKSVDYTINKLMMPGKRLRQLTPFLRQSPELDVYLYKGDRDRENIDIPQENLNESTQRALRLLESGCVEPVLRRELHMQLLKYFYDMDNMRALDDYLSRFPAQELSMEERSQVIRYMVLRGHYHLARQWLDQYGPYFIDPKVLVRLLSPLMQRENMIEDPVLTAAASYAFERGKYDGTVLQYLVMYYRGMTDNMRDIWKAARSFGVDCYRLSEKILVQMLYSGVFVDEKMEIFQYYMSQGAKPEVEEAFLAQCSYDYFVRERGTEREVFREIQYMYARGEPMQQVCKLALLKYYSENVKELVGDAERLAEEILRELMEEGIHMNFFKQFRKFNWLQQELADKTVVEYRTAPGCRSCIHYIILQDNDESQEYSSEYMREVYGGVCFKEFILFFGETLQYYITEERDGESRITEKGSIQKSDDLGDVGDSRYRMVNDIVISSALRDSDTMDDLLEEYFRKDYLYGRLFHLK